MISDYIETLFINKQKLSKLLECDILRDVLESDHVGNIAQANVYKIIKRKIQLINSQLKAAYDHNSHLDNGTQFKIWERVVGKINDFDPEENAFDKLRDLIQKEKMIAVSENKES